MKRGCLDKILFNFWTIGLAYEYCGRFFISNNSVAAVM